MTRRIGLLTGGGDCSGLNAAIRAVVRRAEQDAATVLGFRDGWRGVLDQEAEELTTAWTRGLLHRGGRRSGRRGPTRTARRAGSTASGTPSTSCGSTG